MGKRVVNTNVYLYDKIRGKILWWVGKFDTIVDTFAACKEFDDAVVVGGAALAGVAAAVPTCGAVAAAASGVPVIGTIGGGAICSAAAAAVARRLRHPHRPHTPPERHHRGSLLPRVHCLYRARDHSFI